MIRPVHLPLGRLEIPGPERVDVWLADLADLHLPGTDHTGDRRGYLRDLRIRQQFLLRLLLGAYMGVPGRDVQILRGRNGKPYLAADEPGFSLSHSGQTLVIAVGGRTSVGVDLERERPLARARALARRYFPPSECGFLERCSDRTVSREFLRRWTAREAVIKAAGGSIAGSLSRVEIAGEQSLSVAALPPEWPAAGDWSLHEFGELPGCIGHVAVPGLVTALHFHKLQASQGPES